MGDPGHKSESLDIQNLIDSIPALIHTSLPDGNLDFFNQGWLKYVGLPLEDIAGWKWTSTIHPEDVRGIVAKWRQCLATGEPFQYEARVRRADGEYRWMVHLKVPIRDDRGNIIRWYGFSSDIEDRKRSEFYLAEAQRLAQMGIWAFNPAGGFDFWSKELFLIYGLDPASKAPTLGEYLNCVHPEDRDYMTRLIEKMVAEGLGCDVTKRIVRPSGEVRYIRCVGVPVIENGALNRIVGTAMDLTERKQAEEALLAARAELERVTRVTHLGELTASIAHELNQPLAAVVSDAGASLRWLDKQPPDVEKARAGLKRTIEQGVRAGEIVNRIRRLVAKSPSRKDWVDVNKTVEEVIELTRSEIQRHGISLVTRFSTDLPLIRGDRIQLQQVILNLIINAMEAMSGLTPAELTVKSGKDDTKGVVVSVVDSGRGLQEANVDRLFEPFYTTKPNGIGMGLAICRSIITAHKGRLWATPNVPRGAVFQFTLPSDGRPMESLDDSAGRGILSLHSA
jgi:PAS domain S-box-containing protein